MSLFHGIFNNNGYENTVSMYFDLNSNIPHITDFYVKKTRTDAIINGDTCMIDDVEYNFSIKNYNNEIIIAGKEINNILHWVLPCIYKPKFFVLSNKERV